MAHFAKLDDNNIVISVHVVNNEVINIDGIESEQAGIDFLSVLHNHINWRQTSFNAKFRKNFAAIGYFYDSKLDAFIEPKPFNSWELNKETCRWEAPIPYPLDGYVHPNYGGTGTGKIYNWDEDSKAWVEVIL